MSSISLLNLRATVLPLALAGAAIVAACSNGAPVTDRDSIDCGAFQDFDSYRYSVELKLDAPAFEDTLSPLPDDPLNAFAEALTALPNDHPKRSDVLQVHLKHLSALRRVQQPTGMYCQMLDFPGSYHEFTSTCMIGYAMATGLYRGRLDNSYRDSLDLAWRGVKERIDDAGNVIDSCISTGVQQNRKEYLDRTAIFGPDDRSGSLALWFAVEMERLARGV